MDVILPVPETYNTVALDFDYNEKKIYYSDVKLDVIRYIFQLIIFLVKRYYLNNMLQLLLLL